MAPPKRIVYILKNTDNPPRFYTGVSADLKARLEAHNAGRCSHTAQHRPWAVDVIVKFADETASAEIREVPEIRIWGRVRPTSPKVRPFV
jgi:predicted GIY-YIG superfamily endonuclease